MGFQGVSTDDVFKYALRLDSPSRRLTDGFGMSIVVVNDSSPICVEFLTRYFVDLCHRTADRVRFVFFSGLAQYEVQKIDQEQKSLPNSTRLLGGILERLSGLVGSRRPFRAALSDLLSALPRRYDLEELRGTDPSNWSSRQVETLIEAVELYVPLRGATRLTNSIREVCEVLLSSPQSLHWQHPLVWRLERLTELAVTGSSASRDEWERLGPYALNPIHSPLDTQRRLGWDRDARSSVNGAGMAMEFAHRLGIGMYVPCILVFTDVGELRIDLMPITRDMTAENVYDHVRGWVDSFYEVNRETFHRWRAVEDEIDGLKNQTAASLYRLRRWADLGAEVWRSLRSVTQMLDDLNRLAHDDYDGWSHTTRSHLAANHLTTDVRGRLKEYLPKLDRVSSRARALAKLRAWLPQIESAEGAGSVRAALETFKKEFSDDLPKAACGTLEEALTELGRYNKALRKTDTVTMLERWWGG